MIDMMKEKREKKGRSMLERAQQIFGIINEESLIFPKSRLKAASLDSHTIGNWLELIVFIQSQPRIKVRKVSSYTFIERIETKYSQLYLKRFLDDSLSFNDRLESLTNYMRSIVHQELLLKSEETDKLEASQTGLRSLYDDVGQITDELQIFTHEFYKRFVSEIKPILDAYPQNPEEGHSLYVDLIQQKLPELRMIARGLRDHSSLGQISPRLLREPLPVDFIQRKFSLVEEESYLTGYFIAILSLLYCIIQGLEGWQFEGTQLHTECETLPKVKEISMVTSLLPVVDEEMKRYEKTKMRGRV